MPPDIISVPLCYLPKSKHQIFDMSKCHLSRFQVDFILSISKLPEFAMFDCFMDIIVSDQCEGETAVRWYKKDGTYTGSLVGTNKVWCQLAETKAPPVELSSPAYRWRCR